MSSFERTEVVLGAENVRLLKIKCVAVFGLGGVGSYAVEALSRSGIGRLIIIDNDRIAESNINRQLYALTSTVGRLKTDVCRDRVKDINPDIMVNSYPIFYDEKTAPYVDLTAADYIVDCIDSVKSKVLIAKIAKQYNIPLISALGTGNRVTADFRTGDIFETSGDPLARSFRHELRREGIESLKVVYSVASPVCVGKTVGSVPFVPSVCGLTLAAEVIKAIIGK